MPRFEPVLPPRPLAGPLVGPATDWYNNACLNCGGGTWAKYADGYLKAAQLLVRHVEVEHKDQDTLVFPIVFLFRQSLELKVKYLVRASGELLGRTQKTDHQHSLLRSWNAVPSLLKRMSAEMNQVVLSQEARAEIEGLLAEFEILDQSSMAFRYPVGKNERSLVPSTVTHLNVRQFADHMERLAFRLDELVTATDYFEEYCRGNVGHRESAPPVAT